jgi:hypothetical protein
MVGRDVLGRAGPSSAPVDAPTWRPARPRQAAAVEPWIALTPEAPSSDTRVGGRLGPGVVATLETFGGLTGPAVLAGDDAGAERVPIVLGGAIVPPGTPPPDDAATFAQRCAVRLRVRAEHLGRGRQCLLVFALRGEGPVIVQSFVGLVPVAEDAVHGEDRIAFAVDADDAGGLALALVLRVCGTDPGVRLGVRGVVGYLL